MKVTIYTKPDCPLCDELKEELSALRATNPFTLIEHNIEEDAGQFERYRYLIPVLDIEHGPVLHPPHSWQRTAAALKEASINLTSLNR